MTRKRTIHFHRNEWERKRKWCGSTDGRVVVVQCVDVTAPTTTQTVSHRNGTTPEMKLKKKSNLNTKEGKTPKENEEWEFVSYPWARRILQRALCTYRRQTAANGPSSHCPWLVQTAISQENKIKIIKEGKSRRLETQTIQITCQNHWTCLEFRV